MTKIGLLVISTNKYINFLQPLISSADSFFLKEHDVTYFIFTNQKDIKIDTNRQVIFNYVDHREWPWMTLGRYRIFENNSVILSKMDYLYYCDADMRFVGMVGAEIFGDRVATLHPGYIGRRGTPETNPISSACVYPYEDMQYFAGGFNGGTSTEYLKMSEILSDNIELDFNRGVIAIWHDESHMNRYFIDNRPTLILDPSYCYPECVDILYLGGKEMDRKILALDKNFSIRS
jgi:histo-blood group ABO system transferase